MALVMVGSFTTGFVAGWLTRSVASSTREGLIGTVAAALRTRDNVSRIVGQAVELAEDLIAEGKAQYESARAARGRHAPSGVNAQPEIHNP
jgi:hypothetical protein